jgi:hypothetical protein
MKAFINFDFASDVPIQAPIVGRRFADMIALRLSKPVETSRGLIRNWPKPETVRIAMQPEVQCNVVVPSGGNGKKQQHRINRCF